VRAGEECIERECHGSDATTRPAGSLTTRVDRRAYAVVGASAEELGRSVALLGPRRHGRGHAAYTDWSIRWWSNGAVDVDAVVHLPRWLAPAAGEPALQARWAGYVAALDAHEREHVMIAMAAAAELRRALLAAAGSDQAVLTEVARTVLSEHRARELALDACERVPSFEAGSW
jgi:predicted secreted Zn-dependent protease